MHLYTEDGCWPALAPLAQLLASEARKDLARGDQDTGSPEA